MDGLTLTRRGLVASGAVALIAPQQLLAAERLPASRRSRRAADSDLLGFLQDTSSNQAAVFQDKTMVVSFGNYLLRFDTAKGTLLLSQASNTIIKGNFVAKASGTGIKVGDKFVLTKTLAEVGGQSYRSVTTLTSLAAGLQRFQISRADAVSGKPPQLKKSAIFDARHGRIEKHAVDASANAGEAVPVGCKWRHPHGVRTGSHTRDAQAKR